MDYKEARKTTDEIIKALRNGDYSVSYEEPGNIEECTASDGRTFYKVYDADGPQSSNNFGECTVFVNGYTFTCDLETGEGSTDLYSEMDEEYDVDGKTITSAELIDEIEEVLYERKDICWGEYTEVESEMKVYALANNLEDPEYYWYEDPDCPCDEDDELSDDDDWLDDDEEDEKDEDDENDESDEEK